MGRHSKQAGGMGSENLTHAERQALGYGTAKERLGKDSIKDFDACSLCLQPVQVRCGAAAPCAPRHGACERGAAQRCTARGTSLSTTAQRNAASGALAAQRAASWRTPAWRSETAAAAQRTAARTTLASFARAVADPAAPSSRRRTR